MALIYCIECGGKISDKAKVCMNCGCPVEITLGALKTEEATKKAEDAEVLEVIDRFDILGKEFTVDEKSDKFIMIKSAIFNTKSNYLSIIKSEYQKMGSIDAVIEEFPEIISITLKQLVDSAVDILTTLGVYDYDEYSFYQKYCVFIDTESILEPVVDKYLRILNYEEGIKNYHDQIRKSRSNSWVGGGFGIKGALEGHFKAQLLNAGNAVIHSIPDDIRKNNDLASVRKAKLELYKDESTLNAMLTAMEKIFDSVFDAILVELANANKIRDVVKNKSKADSIINNVIRLSNENKISDKEQIQYCTEAFFEDPTSFKIIETIILLELDDSGDVVRYAQRYKLYEKIEERRQSLLRKNTVKR